MCPSKMHCNPKRPYSRPQLPTFPNKTDWLKGDSAQSSTPCGQPWSTVNSPNYTGHTLRRTQWTHPTTCQRNARQKRAYHPNTPAYRTAHCPPFSCHAKLTAHLLPVVRPNRAHCSHRGQKTKACPPRPPHPLLASPHTISILGSAPLGGDQARPRCGVPPAPEGHSPTRVVVITHDGRPATKRNHNATDGTPIHTTSIARDGPARQQRSSKQCTRLTAEGKTYKESNRPSRARRGAATFPKPTAIAHCYLQTAAQKKKQEKKKCSQKA